MPLLNPETGKRVLVVGAGPSGLSAAYHLRRMGHSVTVRDAGHLSGGMMRFGIPSYRLPRNILDAEVKRIEDMGVKFEFNSKVEDVEEAKREFDAVFLAVGAHIGRTKKESESQAAKAALDMIDADGAQAPDARTMKELQKAEAKRAQAKAKW